MQKLKKKRRQGCAVQLAERTVSKFFGVMYTRRRMCTHRERERGRERVWGLARAAEAVAVSTLAGGAVGSRVSVAVPHSTPLPGHGAVVLTAAAASAQLFPFIWTPRVGGRLSSHINVNVVCSYRRAPPSRVANGKTAPQLALINICTHKDRKEKKNKRGKNVQKTGSMDVSSQSSPQLRR